MTTIIGVEHNGKVFMGADSQGTVGWSRNTMTTRKIVRFNELLIGVAGDLRTINLIQHYFAPPTPRKDMTDEQYINIGVITMIRQCLRDNGWLTIENSKESGDHNAFLVGYRGKLYRIGSDFDVAHYESGIASVGSGYEYALGALHALQTVQKRTYSGAQIETQIKTALKISSQLSIGVSEPFYVESI